MENLSISSDNTTENCDQWNPFASNSFIKNIYILLAVVGIFLNILCLKVLVQPKILNVFDRLLGLLAIFDIFNLINLIGLLSCDPNSLVLQKIFEVTSTFGGTGSVYTTMALTINRCVAIYLPHIVRDNNETLFSRRCAFSCYTSAVLIITVGVLSCNKAYLITNIITYPEDHNIHNIIYYLQTSEIILSFITVIFIFVTNLIMFVTLKNGIEDFKCTICFKPNNQSEFELISKLPQAEDVKCTKCIKYKTIKSQVSILLIIAIMVLVIHMPFILYLILNQIPDGFLKCDVKQILQAILYFTVFGFSIVNASTNFFIYNWSGGQFRKNFMSTRIYCKVAESITAVSNFARSSSWNYRKIIAPGKSVTNVFKSRSSEKYKLRFEEVEYKRRDSIAGVSFVSKSEYS